MLSTLMFQTKKKITLIYVTLYLTVKNTHSFRTNSPGNKWDDNEKYEKSRNKTNIS